MKYFFVAFAFFITSFLHAQYPGGVKLNLKMWLNADNSSTLTTIGTALSTWKYSNDLTKQFTLPLGPAVIRPNVINNNINFHSGVRFDGTQYMTGPGGVNAPITAGDDDYCFFAVWNTSSDIGPNSGQRLFSQRSDCSGNPTGSSFSFATNYITPTNNPFYYNYGAQFEIDTGNHISITDAIAMKFRPFNWNISEINVLNKPSDDVEIIDDKHYSTYSTVSSYAGSGNIKRNIWNTYTVLGARCVANERYYGDVTEMIIYDRNVTALEKQKIFSYLGLKYGMTVESLDYVASDWKGFLGTMFWSTSVANITNSFGSFNYNHDIFGIGRDDDATGSGLFQTISNSMNTGSGDGTGQAGKGNIIIQSQTAEMDNLEFLTIGNDAKSLTETTSNLPSVYSGCLRLQRSWKVQKIGEVGNVDLSFDLNGISTTISPSLYYKFAILVDEDGDGDYTTGTQRITLPNDLNGTKLDFPGLVLHDGEVFTLVTKLIPGVPLASNELSLSVNAVKKWAKLNWIATEPSDCVKYVIELSENNNNVFKPIQEVSPTFAAATNSYSTDVTNLRPGKYVVRVWQINSGNKRVSNRVQFVISNEGIMSISPNPINGAAQLKIDLPYNSAINVIVTSTLGQEVKRFNFDGKRGSNVFNLDLNDLASSTYIIQLTANQIFERIKVVKL